MFRYCQRCRQKREVKWQAPGTSKFCPSCLDELARDVPTTAQKARLARRSPRRKISRERRIAEVAAWVDAYKAKLGCCYCGESDPSCLDGHHEDPASKETTVSALIRRTPNLAVVMRELEKCKVVCASCHRKYHRFMRDNGAERSDAPLNDSGVKNLDESFDALHRKGSMKKKEPAIRCTLCNLYRPAQDFDHEDRVCRDCSDPFRASKQFRTARLVNFPEVVCHTRKAELEQQRLDLIVALELVDVEQDRQDPAPRRSLIAALVKIDAEIAELSVRLKDSESLID